MYKTYIKGILDFTAAFVGLILLSPIVILSIIFLYFVNQGKPFFFQPRPGKNSKIFYIIKFKTMNDKRDENGNLLPDSKRITKIGAFIRKTSMDEIPQLINVLKGDMSLVGPRPLLIKYLPFYTERENLRHSVRPGITGWAQVNGRNTLNWDSRLEYDAYYVENLSFLFDVKILIKTIKKVVKSENVVVDTNSFFKDLDEEREINFKSAEKPYQLESIIKLHQLILKGTLLENKNIYYDSNYEKFLTKVFELQNNHFFVVERNSIIIGFAHFKIIDDFIFLNNIAISESVNNIGLGKKLLFYSYKNLINQYSQINNFKLDVFQSNTKALNWYKTMGFEEEKRNEWYQLNSKLNVLESNEYSIFFDQNGFLGIYDGEVKFGTIVNNNLILHQSDYIYKINSEKFDSILTNDDSFINNDLFNSNNINYDLTDSSIRMKISIKKFNQNYFNEKQN